MKPKLLDRVQGKIRLRHYSIRTEEAYLHWIMAQLLYGAGLRLMNARDFGLKMWTLDTDKSSLETAATFANLASSGQEGKK